MASTPAQQAGGISAAKDPARALEPGLGVGGGGPFEGNSASKASTGPGGGRFCDSASDTSVSLHRVREAFGILFLFFFSVFEEADIGTPAKSWTPQPHLKAASWRAREPGGREPFPPTSPD